MAAIINVPFNFQPANTGSTISSYTVPAGKYARVQIYDRNTRFFSVTTNGTAITFDTITLNGTTLFYNNQIGFTIYASSSSTIRATFTTYSKIEADLLTFTIGTGGGSAYVQNNTVAIANLASQSNSSYPIKISSGDLTCSAGSGGAYRINGIIYPPNPVSSVDIWLKSGDVIGNSSNYFNIIYQEFNNIS